MNSGKEESHPREKDKKPFWQRKWFKVFAWVVGLMVLVLVLITAIFEDKVMSLAEKEINANLLYPAEFSDSGMSFFKGFPAVTLYFDDMKIRGSDTLVEAPLAQFSSFALSFDWIKYMVTGNVEIDGIKMKDPVISIHVDEQGNPNYNFLSEAQGGLKRLLKDLDEKGKVFNLKGIFMDEAELIVTDEARDLNLHVSGWDLKADGAYEAGEIVLETDSRMKDVDMTFRGYDYLNEKVLESEHLTIIRPNELSLVFERNDMNINKLNFDFKGQMDFLERGLRVDMLLRSAPSELSDIVSALPERFVKWHRVKELELSGEAVASIQLKGESVASTGQRPDLNVTLSWKDGTLLPKGVKTPMQDIYLDLEAMVPGLDFDHMKVSLDTINFKNGQNFLKGHFNLERDVGKLNMEGDLAARLNLENLTKTLALDSIALKGDLTSDIHINGVYDSINGVYPALKGSLKVQGGGLNTVYYPEGLENIRVDMDLAHDGENPKKGSLNIREARFDFEGESFTADVLIEDLTDPLITLNCKGVLHPGKINRVFGKEDLDLDGVIKMDFMVKTRQSTVKKREFDQMVSSGGFDLESMTLESAYLKGPVKLKSGAFRFSKGSIRFENFLGSYARSNFSLNGELRHFLKNLFYENEKVHGRFMLDVDRVYMEDLLLKKDEVASGETPSQNRGPRERMGDSLQPGVLQIPGFIDITLDYKAGEFYWDQLKVRDIRGLIAVVEGGLFIKDARLEIIGTTLQLDGVYKNFGSSKAYFEYDVEVSEFDIERAYNEVEMFRNLAPAAKDASGIVGLNYHLSGVLNEDMKVLLPSLKGGGLLTLRDVRIKNNDILAEVSKSTGNKQLLDAELEEIGIPTHIDHGVIDVDEFNFRVKPFRLRMEGQTTLDRQINMKMRLGLPPGGILGIPIKVTGTAPDLQVRLGKKTKNLDESFYEEDGITALKMARYSAFSDSLTADMSIGELQKVKERVKKAPAGNFKPSGGE